MRSVIACFQIPSFSKTGRRYCLLTGGIHLQGTPPMSHQLEMTQQFIQLFQIEIIYFLQINNTANETPRVIRNAICVIEQSGLNSKMFWSCTCCLINQ
ncbi:hypothetical protein FGO68_gene4824 [Halteria grandinella]|uniref:Uncharacterized protein n=1 Tax=Halteria grandinella TaxID=5974 RepID=A0A8J8P068_HALGN|nr:hypothetical protein FGO68_gene4824 [Halteria grandinella]